MGINFTLILQCFWVRGSLLRFNTNINKNPCPLKDYLCLKYLFGLHEASGQVGDWARRRERENSDDNPGLPIADYSNKNMIIVFINRNQWI